MTDAELQEVEDIYRLLCKGLGHEKVTDDNVDALIRRAERDGYALLATELRESSEPRAPRHHVGGIPDVAPQAGTGKRR